MNKRNWIILVAGLVMIGGSALALNRLKAGQKLGAPGIKTSPIPGSPRLDIFLPQQVLNYDSTNIPTDAEVLKGLPQDTSFAQRHYMATNNPMDSFQMLAVLMGADRTSIHKPEFCLRGSGWDILAGKSSRESIRIESPHPYDLPVTKLMLSRVYSVNGQNVTYSGIYVYWFVADRELAARHGSRMWQGAIHVLVTGELQRWAYIGCLVSCPPGEEAAAYERLKKFIAASVPEFQLATGSRADARAPARLAALQPD